MAYPIETGIPLAKLRMPEVASELLDTLRNVGPGESFLVPTEHLSTSTPTRVYQYAARHGAIFRTRSVPGGMRVWRMR